MLRLPNSQECLYYGRKLSNICVPEIEVKDGYACIGSDRDDEIYFPPVLKEGEEMLKERVMIYAFHEEGDIEYVVNIDLEDVLKFAAENCRGIYDRVRGET